MNCMPDWLAQMDRENDLQIFSRIKVETLETWTRTWTRQFGEVARKQGVNKVWRGRWEQGDPEVNSTQREPTTEHWVVDMLFLSRKDRWCQLHHDLWGRWPVAGDSLTGGMAAGWEHFLINWTAERVTLLYIKMYILSSHTKESFQRSMVLPWKQWYTPYAPYSFKCC